MECRWTEMPGRHTVLAKPLRKASDEAQIDPLQLIATSDCLSAGPPRVRETARSGCRQIQKNGTSPGQYRTPDSEGEIQEGAQHLLKFNYKLWSGSVRRRCKQR